MFRYALSFKYGEIGEIKFCNLFIYSIETCPSCEHFTNIIKNMQIQEVPNLIRTHSAQVVACISH